MKKLANLFLIILLLPPLTIAAQESPDTAMMQKIRQEEFGRSQITMLAHQLTDVCGPRLTNSPGYKTAVAWAVRQLNNWGIAAVPESWGQFGRGWKTDKVYVAITQPWYQPMIAYPRAWTAGTNGLVAGSVLMLEKQDSANINKLGKSVDGKIVIVRTSRTALRSVEGSGVTRFKKEELDSLPDDYAMTLEGMQAYRKSVKDENDAMAYLKLKGALAILTKYYVARDGTIFVNGTTAFANKSAEPLPQIVITTEDYLKLQRLLDDGKPVAMEMDMRNRWYADSLEGYNVIGEIAGTDPLLKSQMVMLGAHLDSWHSGTGATDNAAGCVVMMEAMRLLKALGVQPRRTIRIALWGGEEQGLKGSFGYVKKHFGNPADMRLKPEQKTMSVYFNLDNGTGKIRGIYLQHNDSVRPVFESWLRPFADLDATGITNSNAGSTDHLSFDAVGIPAFEFIQDPLEYDTRTHHSNMDVYDHLAIDDLKQAAVIVAGFIYNAAMRNGMLPRKPLPKPGKFIFDTDETTSK